MRHLGATRIALATRWPGPVSSGLTRHLAHAGIEPLVTATGTGAGQAGYVHYFLIGSPDDALEIQVGIELPDQRIAWSFPDPGAVASPFIESGVTPAGGKDYELFHLYGIRPFPDDGAMAALRRELADRLQPWLAASGAREPPRDTRPRTCCFISRAGSSSRPGKPASSASPGWRFRAACGRKKLTVPMSKDLAALLPHPPERHALSAHSR